MKKKYKLDNMGIYFSSTNNSKYQNVFRFSCKLTENIEKNHLKKALNKCLELFPNFKTKLKKGFFWYYLETSNDYYNITKGNMDICSNINLKDNNLIRVNINKKIINLEISHIISDGIGCLKFFKTLLFLYLKNKYPSEELDMSLYNEDFIKENTYDSYKKCDGKGTSKISKNKSILKIKQDKEDKITYSSIYFNTSDVIKLSKKYNVTVTSFLVSSLVYSICLNINKKDYGKTIKVDIPVDLRKYFNSNTARNFFSLTHIKLKIENNNNYFRDIIKLVDKDLKEKTKIENLLPRINKMLSFERNIAAEIVPISIKDIVLSLIDQISVNKYTTCFSNIGKIDIPNNFKKYIVNFEVITSTPSFQFTTCSYENIFTMGISSITKDNKIIKTYLDVLNMLGLKQII